MTRSQLRKHPGAFASMLLPKERPDIRAAPLPAPPPSVSITAPTAPVRSDDVRSQASTASGLPMPMRMSIADVVPPYPPVALSALMGASRSSLSPRPSARRSLRHSAARILFLPPPSSAPSSPSPRAAYSPTPSEELRAAAMAEGVRTPRPSRERRLSRIDKCHIARCLPARCIFAFMANIGFAIIYGLKVNLSIAIVAMVQEDVGVRVAASECQPSDAEGKAADDAPGAKYQWDGSVQGVVMSSYFYGYLVSQIPGAILADMFSAKWVLWFAVLANVVGCAVMPMVALVHWSLVVAVRVIQGIGAGVTFPAMHTMISNWAPPSSRSVFTGVIYAGTAMGMVVSTLISGYVTAALRWEWMFYISAALCVPWLICWMLWIEDDPLAAVYITKQERVEIVTEIGDELVLDPHTRERLRFPCRDIARSKPFWAILVAHVGGNCGLYCFITQVPSFMKKVLHQDLKSNTNLSTIPYIAMFVVSNMTGPPLDYLRSRGKITTTTARKIGATVAMLIPAACLVGISFIGCSVHLGLTCITIAVGCLGAQSVAWLGNHIDISPNFAGLLMGITNTLATIPGMTVPTLLGYLTAEDNSLTRWSIGFYAIAGIMLFSYIFYLCCAAGEVQYWNNPLDIPPRPSKEERRRARSERRARGSRA